MSEKQSKRQLGTRRPGGALEELELVDDFKERRLRDRERLRHERWVGFTEGLGARSPKGHLRFTSDILDAGTDLALEVIFQEMWDGNLEAAALWLKYAVAQPELPLSLRISQMDERQAAHAMTALLAKKGFTGMSQEGLLAAFSDEMRLALPEEDEP